MPVGTTGVAASRWRWRAEASAAARCYGKSDKHAAEPVDGIVRPADFLATIFHCLGFTPETQLHDAQGRPFPLTRGRVIEDVLT